MYNQKPVITINSNLEILNNSEIKKQIQHKLKTGNVILELYPGVDEAKIINELELKEYVTTSKIFLSKNEIIKKFPKIFTDDRVFGYMYKLKLSDIICNDYQNIKAEIPLSGQVIIGVGASKLAREKDYQIYFDISRWSIQTRWRTDLAENWFDLNFQTDLLQKFKIGYFFEWRIGDAHKQAILNDCDLYCDTNQGLKFIKTKKVDELLEIAVNQPFRTVPYFDQGVWGGNWMQEKLKLDANKPNFAWAFDGVPEENSIAFSDNENQLEMPAMNLTLFKAESLLSKHITDKYGAEFPIRFDYLDTMNGQNLSLQVHPLKQYIKTQFGMNYTQDESYYILDAKPGAKVYLGLKTGCDLEKMFSEMENPVESEFKAEEYINVFPAKKHDHFLIPAGTIHCSGADTVVLEISATPYIFTFKLWDWNRLGLDGKPRPIHLNHGKANVLKNRDTDWVKANLINNFTKISETATKTGLHELEPIETIVHTFKGELRLKLGLGVNMLNLVEGKNIEIIAIDNKFKPQCYHYGETFIIPATIEEVIVKSLEEVKLIQAFCR